MPHSDTWIIEQSAHGMIVPFLSTLIRTHNGVKRVSYGTASYAYDMRLDYGAKMPISGVLDVKQPELAVWVDVPVHTNEWGEYIEIPAHGFVLAPSVECWSIPDDVYVLVVGKSSYARNALLVNCTPMEPGWKGVLNIELVNTTTLPVRVYIGEGIAAAIFFQGDEPCLTGYADRGGKYQGQTGVMKGLV